MSTATPSSQIASEAHPNKTPLTNVAIIGGCGFLGANLVSLLLDHHPSCRITVLDLRLVNQNPNPQVEYISADITNKASLEAIFKRVKPEVVIHTASPIHGLGEKVYMAVNVGGTKNLVEVSQEAGVKAFVFTSSAGVVFDGGDLINVNETAEIPKVAMDAYNDSKAIAESIALSANGKFSMLTTAIRPAGIFGPGDRQVIPGFMTVLKNKQTLFQLGSNDNLFDWTYITNVAYGHILAASVLLAQYPSGPSAESVPPMARVDGQPFFITNGEPIPFWDFAHALWAAHGDQRTWYLQLPPSVAMVIGGLGEFFSGLMGREPGLTRFRVKFSCSHRYFDIRKAKELLGYEPLVGMYDGFQKAIEWYDAEHDWKGEKKAQ